MTLGLFLRLWPSVTILILLAVDLAFPLGPVRRWLEQGDHVAVPPLRETEGPWVVIRDGEPDGQQYDSPQAAARALSWPARIRAWAADMWQCPWCIGGWIALAGVAACLPGSTWDRIQWWPCVWLAASGTAVVLKAIADH
jgi:hypothetical protein